MKDEDEYNSEVRQTTVLIEWLLVNKHLLAPKTAKDGNAPRILETIQKLASDLANGNVIVTYLTASAPRPVNLRTVDDAYDYAIRSNLVTKTLESLIPYSPAASLTITRAEVQAKMDDANAPHHAPAPEGRDIRKEQLMSEGSPIKAMAKELFERYRSGDKLITVHTVPTSSRRRRRPAAPRR